MLHAAATPQAGRHVHVCVKHVVKHGAKAGAGTGTPRGKRYGRARCSRRGSAHTATTKEVVVEHAAHASTMAPGHALVKEALERISATEERLEQGACITEGEIWPAEVRVAGSSAATRRCASWKQKVPA